ncbi:unnamed protein product [Effrenium voratum]|nr:unnamed protein product [Effrenium voratum]|mmetsp:Transcript_62586/g.149236  ORF Transcript_62586/g.149236 Transcript_62586/m.149236 type:complete len:502 (+) Transcript_62586:156-1661(+)
MLWLGLLVSVRADVLEDWISPLGRDAFFAATFEQQWAHFPHPSPLVPISLDHVAEWVKLRGRDDDVIETLAHPTGRSFKSLSSNPVEYIQEAFLQGHSMVINSLQRWSEPGKRLAKDLYAACDLPVDVYMYFTPPHSRSYGLHSDVMDAFMVQLAGAKTWRVCDAPSWRAPNLDPEQALQKLNASCDTITMRGGDVMYLPYGTLHQATTYSDFSMHLTVNLERQYYVWLALIIAMMHKAARPELTVQGFIESGDFQVDDPESALFRALSRLSPMLPELHRVPGTGAANVTSTRLLTAALCNEDLPEGYEASLEEEKRELVAKMLAHLRADATLASRKIQFGRRVVPFLEAAELLQSETLGFALQLVRYHSAHYVQFLDKPDLFASLSAIRSHLGPDSPPVKLSALASKLPEETMLVRAPRLRAALIGDVGLVINGVEVPVTRQQIPAALFALGLFKEGTAQGQPFALAEARKTGEMKLFQKLLKLGALQVVGAAGEALLKG